MKRSYCCPKCSTEKPLRSATIRCHSCNWNFQITSFEAILQYCREERSYCFGNHSEVNMERYQLFQEGKLDINQFRTAYDDELDSLIEELKSGTNLHHKHINHMPEGYSTVIVTEKNTHFPLTTDLIEYVNFSDFSVWTLLTTFFNGEYKLKYVRKDRIGMHTVSFNSEETANQFLILLAGDRVLQY
jgi:hypothetical protein